MKTEKIIQIFKDAGMAIEAEDTLTVKGPVSSLVKGCEALIEQCALTIETQDRSSDYQWVNGSFWGCMTRRFAMRIRGVMSIKDEGY